MTFHLLYLPEYRLHLSKSHSTKVIHHYKLFLISKVIIFTLNKSTIYQHAGASRISFRGGGGQPPLELSCPPKKLYY